MISPEGSVMASCPRLRRTANAAACVVAYVGQRCLAIGEAGYRQYRLCTDRDEFDRQRLGYQKSYRRRQFRDK